MGAAIKREPSHYRLVAHKYMLASRRGIISGPKVHTHASTVPKRETPINEDTDSDATVIVEEDIKPTVPTKEKLPDVTRNQRKRPSRKGLLQKPTSLERGQNKVAYLQGKK